MEGGDDREDKREDEDVERRYRENMLRMKIDKGDCGDA